MPVSQASSSWRSEFAGLHRILKVYTACRPWGWRISPLCSKTVILSWEFWELERPGIEKSCTDLYLILICIVVFQFSPLHLTFSTLKPLFSLSSSPLSPPPSPLSRSLSAPLRKTLLTMLKSQQTKPWTTGINSHQQITDSSVASFPEICNTLHMGAKCVPDARGSCVVQAVLSAPRDLCYVIKNCALSYPLPNTGDIFITYCLCLHIYLFIFQLRWRILGLFWLRPADSTSVLIRYCLRKACPKRIRWNALPLMCNQWSSRRMVKQRSDLSVRSVAFGGSDGRAGSATAVKCKIAHDQWRSCGRFSLCVCVKCRL